MALWKCPEPECQAVNKSTADSCEVCGEGRPSRRRKTKDEVPAKTTINVDQCSRCDTVSKSTGAFHPDDPEALPEDRGKRLCPSCWIEALKRRAAGQTRESRCTEPGCDKTAGEHITDFRRYGEIIMARMGPL